MTDIRTRIAIVTICTVLLLVCSLTLLHHHADAAAPPIILTSPGQTNDGAQPANPSGNAAAPAPETTEIHEDKQATVIYVHVAGAVKRPSLYELTPGSRVMHAVRAAGGPTRVADLDAVNLAEKVEDGEKIYIPAKSTPHTAVAPPGNRIGHFTMRPRQVADVKIEPLPVITGASPESAPTGEDAAHSEGHHANSGHHHGESGGSGKLSSPAEGLVNINTASDTELERLPGVGPAIAARIIAYRQENHGFQKPEDIMNVTGIGEKKYAKMSAFLTAS